MIIFYINHILPTRTWKTFSIEWSCQFRMECLHCHFDTVVNIDVPIISFHFNGMMFIWNWMFSLLFFQMVISLEVLINNEKLKYHIYVMYHYLFLVIIMLGQFRFWRWYLLTSIYFQGLGIQVTICL